MDEDLPSLRKFNRRRRLAWTQHPCPHPLGAARAALTLSGREGGGGGGRGSGVFAELV